MVAYSLPARVAAQVDAPLDGSTDLPDADPGAPPDTGNDAGTPPPPAVLTAEPPPAEPTVAPAPEPGPVSEPADASPLDVTVRATRAAGPGEYNLHGTGSKQNLPLEQVAATVSVVDRKTLDERGALDAQQALSLVPGLTPMWTYGGFQAVQARGFQALVLVDGRRDSRSILSGSAPLTAIFDLDRIEVLRGPSAVMFGYGAVGGSVNLIHRRASATPSHTLSLGLGTPRQFVAHVGSQGPILPKLSYRLDLGHVSYRNFRGYESARSQGTTSLRYAPSRDHTLQMRVSYSFDRYNTDVGIPTLEDPSRPGTWGLPQGTRYENRYATKNDGLDYQRLDLSLDYRWDLTHDVYVEARGGLTRDRYSYLAAESQTFRPATAGSVAQVERSYLGFAHQFRPLFAQLELHADVHTGPIRHQLVAGYQLDHVTGATDRNGLGGAKPGPIDFVWPIDRAETVALQRNAIDHRRHVMHGLYAFDHITLADALFLTGGVRLDFLRSRTRREFLDVQLQQEIPEPATGEVRSWNRTTDFAPSGQVGLIYNPWEPLYGYVSYGNGYKPQFVSASATSVTRYDPELSNQFEGGLRIRAEGRGHALHADAAGYLIRRKNLLVPRGVDQQVEAGLVQSRGLDLSVAYTAPRFLFVTGGYSLIDAAYEKFVAPSSTQPMMNVDLAGNVLRLAPRHSGTLWARITPAEPVELGVGARFVGRQYADDENRLQLPRYGLLDASLRYKVSRLSFQLTANNLLDRHKYFSSVIRSGSATPQLTPGAGREILGVVKLEL